MGAVRGEFSSKLGFIMAASGSAVGLGNIWGFPTQAASNGGGAFLLVYLVMAFLLAYPALMAELIIGRHTKANAVKALQDISTNAAQKKVGALTGLVGIVTASLILSFYGIVAGWMVAYCLSPMLTIVGAPQAAAWLTEFSITRNVVFDIVFMVGTILIICGGVKEGIEKWSTRLMPTLIVILLALIVYVLTLDGASEGIKAYLVPDFSAVLDITLIVNALGQAFFSLSLGVGTMLIYGSYVSEKENIISLGRMVTLVDIGIAVAAGLLIVPAMYVAQYNGVVIYDQAGQLIAEDRLIFTVLPALFDTMGAVGIYVAFAFFALMTIASLTSSISMLEVPVAFAVESLSLPRTKATWLMGGVITIISVLIIANFDMLFSAVVAVTTRYSQPLLGLMLCVFAGWIWNRNQLLKEIEKGCDKSAVRFCKWWPFYVKYVCPLIILVVFSQLVSF